MRATWQSQLRQLRAPRYCRCSCRWTRVAFSIASCASRPPRVCVWPSTCVALAASCMRSSCCSPRGPHGSWHFACTARPWQYGGTRSCTSSRHAITTRSPSPSGARRPIRPRIVDASPGMAMALCSQFAARQAWCKSSTHVRVCCTRCRQAHGCRRPAIATQPIPERHRTAAPTIHRVGSLVSSTQPGASQLATRVLLPSYFCFAPTWPCAGWWCPRPRR